jgi:pimeloyl-ACP methyl ester carboxylesterase
MIAHIVAAEYPQRVKSLVSMMSTSGDPTLPGPAPRVLQALLRRRARRDAERGIVQTADFLRLIGSPGFPTGEAELRAKVERSVRRSYRPDGWTRQFIAIQSAGNRTWALRRIRAPTLVMHGADDPLIPAAAGRRTAANIPGARLKIIPGWGHDLPGPSCRDLWTQSPIIAPRPRPPPQARKPSCGTAGPRRARIGRCRRGPQPVGRRAMVR